MQHWYFSVRLEIKFLNPDARHWSTLCTLPSHIHGVSNQHCWSEIRGVQGCLWSKFIFNILVIRASITYVKVKYVLRYIKSPLFGQGLSEVLAYQVVVLQKQNPGTEQVGKRGSQENPSWRALREMEGVLKAAIQAGDEPGKSPASPWTCPPNGWQLIGNYCQVTPWCQSPQGLKG